MPQPKPATDLIDSSCFGSFLARVFGCDVLDHQLGYHGKMAVQQCLVLAQKSYQDVTVVISSSV